MAMAKLSNGNLIRSLKKSAAIITTTGFLAAAAFLVVGLLVPANAASSSTAADVQTSLLSLDKPQPPATRLSLPQLTAEEKEKLAGAIAPDLATELNNWAYTATPLQSVISLYDNLIRVYFTLQLSLIRAQMSFWVAVLDSNGLNVLAQKYVAAINLLTQTINSLNSPSS